MCRLQIFILARLYKKWILAKSGELQQAGLDFWELDFLKRIYRSLIVNRFRLKLTGYFTLKICLPKLVDQERNERLCRTINGLRESLSSDEITDPRLSLDPLLVDEVRLFVFAVWNHFFALYVEDAKFYSSD